MKHKWKYPKLIILISTFVLAYFIFAYLPLNIEKSLSSFGYLGAFITGILFAYGFTAAPATAIFLILAKSQPVFITAIVGGLGSLIGNLLIFHIARSSLKDEITKFEHEKEVIKIERSIPYKIRKHLLLVLAGFILATPLPDEVAVSLFAASHKISIKLFSIISYLLHTIGILVIILIGVKL